MRETLAAPEDKDFRIATYKKKKAVKVTEQNQSKMTQKQNLVSCLVLEF